MYYAHCQWLGNLLYPLQLRETIFNFAQKELAPLAYEIDKNNKFDDLKGFWKKLGKLGALGKFECQLYRK